LEIQAQGQLAEDIFRRQKWPLGIMAADMIRFSQANEGRALNVIVKLSHLKEVSADIGEAAELVNQTTEIAARAVATDRSNPAITLYNEMHSPTRLSGQGLEVTLWSALQTVPTALIEVTIPSKSRFRLTVSHWGSGFEQSRPVTAGAPMLIDLTPLADDEHQRRLTLALGISSLIASLGDTFQAIHRPHDMPVPVLPRFMEHATQLSVPDAYWKPITDVYLKAYESVAA
jgi:hypothetical protein